MDESNKNGPNVDPGEDLLSDRLDEATSDKLVSDLPETTKSDNSDSRPSPDGELDESDEIKEAGPM